MSHYHVGYNLSGQKPEGEVATYRTLDEAKVAHLAAIDELVRGFEGQPVSVTDDTDPDCPLGTSAWVTVNVDLPDEFAYYVWVGQDESSAGEPCDCANCETCDHSSRDHGGEDIPGRAAYSACLIFDCGCPALVVDPTPVEPWEVTR